MDNKSEFTKIAIESNPLHLGFGLTKTIDEKKEGNSEIS